MHAERLERLARGHQIHPPLFFLANHSDRPLLVWSFLALKAHFLEGELGPRNEGYEAGGARREDFLLIAGFVVNNAAWSTGTDDISVEIMFSSTADEGRYQLGWRQFVQQLAFNSKLLPNRHLPLATQRQRPFEPGVAPIRSAVLF